MEFCFFFFPHPRSARQNWKELLPSLMGENETLYWPLSEKLKISLFPASVPNPMTLISRSETKILFLLFFCIYVIGMVSFFRSSPPSHCIIFPVVFNVTDFKWVCTFSTLIFFYFLNQRNQNSLHGTANRWLWQHTHFS